VPGWCGAATLVAIGRTSGPSGHGRSCSPTCRRPTPTSSRAAFAPPRAEAAKTRVIAPSIDPFSAKNEPMSRRNVRLALTYVGLLDGDGYPPIVPFARRDGSPGRINRHVDVVQSGPAPGPDAPLVIQASRWDYMKDMAGVMEGFADHVDPALGAHLILAGPAATGVADDPEAAQVYNDCVDRWHRLPHATRGRIHLACVPMNDPDEAAAIVNALQRHATVVVQKSLAEDFGSPSPKRCGNRSGSSRAQSAASATRSQISSTGC
jgi:trehalose synthase